MYVLGLDFQYASGADAKPHIHFFTLRLLTVLLTQTIKCLSGLVV